MPRKFLASQANVNNLNNLWFIHVMDLVSFMNSFLVEERGQKMNRHASYRGCFSLAKLNYTAFSSQFKMNDSFSTTTTLHCLWQIREEKPTFSPRKI